PFILLSFLYGCCEVNSFISRPPCAITPAAAVLPVVKRNWRRFGRGDSGEGDSFGFARNPPAMSYRDPFTSESMDFDHDRMPGMPKASSYLPAGFTTLSIHLTVNGAAKYIEFLKQAFDAVELTRSASPDGRLLNASVRIGDSVMMLNDVFP